MNSDLSNIKIPQFPDINALQASLHEKKDDSMYKWECSNCGRKFEYKERECPDCSNLKHRKFYYIGEGVLFKCPRCQKRFYHLKEKEYLCPNCKSEEDVKLICIESDSKEFISNDSNNVKLITRPISNEYERESCKWHVHKNRWDILINVFSNIIYIIVGFILGKLF